MWRLLFVLALFILAPNAQAASLYIDPAFSQLSRGDSIKLAVRLDTDETVRECVNAVDGIITYTGNITPVDISVGDSIFSMWVEEPTINTDTKTITFAGGLPNGYCGRVSGDPRLTNTILEIIVRLPGFSVGADSDNPVASVAFAPGTTAYLNDGLGTQAELTTYGAELALSKEAGATLMDPWNDEVAADQIPPEEFSIFLEKDEKTFRGDYYIVFNTSDKQTGIDEYQVMEEPSEMFSAFTWGRADAPWIVARSPYVLKDQSLNSTIRVKAIDKAGNEYIATLVPDQSLRGISTQQVLTYLFGVGLVVLVVSLGFGAVVFYRRRKEALAAEVTEEQHD